MSKIEIARPLKDLLDDSDLQAPLRALADRVGEIVADNKLAFFPDYTDHGTDHINQVMQSEVDLVPSHLWERCKTDSGPRPLYDVDAAVIVGATLLHDIAMHMAPEGFLELIADDSRFRPLPWFKENQEGHLADRPWAELWQDYVREARRFNDRSLGSIVGQESVRLGWKFEDLPADRGRWELNHRLVVGEFLRRHHARLAHEIAIHGFPGLPIGSGEGFFPALGSERGHPLIRLADLIGLTARSHGTSLRVCKAYLDASPLYPGTPRPMGAAVLYAMALLRVSDYLQIDRKRAPAVLLHLRNPQSPISVQEWKKHLAVQSIGPATDPRGKTVTVSTDLSLELYLQLSELVAGLQGEMDHSSAVLDEVYGTRTDVGLDQLGLATRRVYSNLHSPAFRDSLPYVPERTGFAADPNLLTLLVEPLYGQEPNVGVRELMQNSIDAVNELHAWCAAHSKSLVSLDLPDQQSDVLIEFIKRANGTWFLRVRDKGIGMRGETIQNYFLRAGASFRQSPEWAKDFMTEAGGSRVMRAGRFGIGVFAIFLMGPVFRLWTRHVAAERGAGYAIEGSADSDLIEIRRVDNLPVGTTIEVEISSQSVDGLNLEKSSNPDAKFGLNTDWFCWDWPSVTRRLVSETGPTNLPRRFTLPIRNADCPPHWSIIHPEGFDAVYWTYTRAPCLTCNGLVITDPSGLEYLDELDFPPFDWPTTIGMAAPNLAVLDSAANLPLTTQRDSLSSRELTFIGDLTRDVTLSFIAHSLVCGPADYHTAASLREASQRHPLVVKRVSEYPDYPEYAEYRAPVSPHPPLTASGRLRWCITSSHMVPADPWLYRLLKTDLCLVHGLIGADSSFWHRAPEPFLAERLPISDYVLLRWDGMYRAPGEGQARGATDLMAKMSSELVSSGVLSLGHDVLGIRIMVFVPSGLRPLWADAININKHESQKLNWREVTPAGSPIHYYELRAGTVTSAVPLENWLSRPSHDGSRRTRIKHAERLKWSEKEIRYVAEIHTESRGLAPDSLIAIMWNECLGPMAIPFDPTARRELIEHGRRHPELRRHIEAWERLQQATIKEGGQSQP